MANRTKVPCHARPCPELVDPKARYCEAHAHLRKRFGDSNYKKQWKPPLDYTARAKLYKTKKWTNLRRFVLSRNPRCVDCGDVATQVDHITPVKDGGQFFAIANLQPLCRSCHSSKTRSELNQGDKSVIK